MRLPRPCQAGRPVDPLGAARRADRHEARPYSSFRPSPSGTPAPRRNSDRGERPSLVPMTIRPTFSVTSKPGCAAG